LAKAGDTSSIPVQQIPIEKGEPLALELAHFVDSVAKSKQPKVGATSYPYTGESGYECMPTIYSDARGPFARNVPLASQIRTAVREAGFSPPIVTAGGICEFDQAEAILERDVEHTFRSLLRGHGYTMDEFAAAPSVVRDLPIGVLVCEPQLLGAPIVSDEELRFYVDVYERSGFTGGLNWYRAYRTNIEEARGVDYRIDKPALMISAADDWFWGRDSTVGMVDLLPQLEAHVVRDAAHWLLSLYTPAENDAVDWKRGNYATVVRSGRIESSAHWGQPKQPTTMITEGSVLMASNELRGAASNVAPEGFPHPVYRAGFAVTIPIPWRVAA